MVDPINRELLLSFGTLIETIRQAAPALGYRVELQVLAERVDAPDIAQVHWPLVLRSHRPLRR
jgi:hypothetical protein